MFSEVYWNQPLCPSVCASLGNRRSLVWSVAQPIFFSRIYDTHCDRIHSSLLTVLGKQPVVWEEYCAEYWLKELQESMDRCSGCCAITEILLKMASYTKQSMNQPSVCPLVGNRRKCWKSNVASIELFTTQSRLITTCRKMPFERTVGKGENAGKQHFLLFPQCFLLYQEEKLSFLQHLICRLQMLWVWASPKFCRLLKSKMSKICCV